MGFSLIGLGGGKRNTPQTKGEKQGALVKLFAIILFLVSIGCFIAACVFKANASESFYCFIGFAVSLVISCSLSHVAGWLRKLDIPLTPEQTEKIQAKLKKYEYKYVKKADKKQTKKKEKAKEK